MQTPTGDKSNDARALRMLAPLMLAAAGVLAYGNSFNGALVYDDLHSIRDNPTIRSLWPPQKVFVAPARSTFGGRPIVNFSFALNQATTGSDRRGYHATNIAIHIASAILLFLLLRRVFLSPRLRDRFGRSADGTAFAAAILWVVHPLTSEVVTYTSTRTEGLMAMFFLATLYCAMRGWLVAAVAACAMGMGSKEVMAVAPLMVLLFDLLLNGEGIAATIRRRPVFYLALFATMLIVPALLFFFVSFKAKTGFGLERASPLTYATTQLGVIAHYLRLAFWPYPLTVDYDDWPLARSILDVLPQAVLVLGMVTLTGWLLLRRHPAALLGVWFFLILAPTSSIIPLGTEVCTERRMYLPLMALIIAMVAMARTVIRGARTAAFLVSALTLVLAAATFWRNGDYASPVIFWNDAVAKRPNNLRAMSQLVRAYEETGQFPAAREIAQRMLALVPNDPRTHAVAGDLLIGEGKLDDAVMHLSRATELDPKDELAKTNLGLALARQGKLAAAMQCYREALDIDPNCVDAHVYLGDTLLAQGKRDEARSHYQIALTLQPNDQEIKQKLDRAR